MLRVWVSIMVAVAASLSIRSWSGANAIADDLDKTVGQSAVERPLVDGNTSVEVARESATQLAHL